MASVAGVSLPEIALAKRKMLVVGFKYPFVRDFWEVYQTTNYVATGGLSSDKIVYVNAGFTCWFCKAAFLKYMSVKNGL